MEVDSDALTPELLLDRYRCGVCRARVDEHDGARCEGWIGVTPRFAWALHGALIHIGDWWEDDTDALDLPRIAVRVLDNPSFRHGMQASAHRLAAEIASGRVGDLLCRSTGDEVNLAMALDDACADITEGATPLPPQLDHPRDVDPVEDYYDAGEILRADSDVDMLFNPALDGIEDDDATLRHLGIGADHLRPEAWLVPFRPEGGPAEPRP